MIQCHTTFQHVITVLEAVIIYGEGARGQEIEVGRGENEIQTHFSKEALCQHSLHITFFNANLHKGLHGNGQHLKSKLTSCFNRMHAYSKTYNQCHIICICSLSSLG